MEVSHLINVFQKQSVQYNYDYQEMMGLAIENKYYWSSSCCLFSTRLTMDGDEYVSSLTSTFTCI